MRGSGLAADTVGTTAVVHRDVKPQNVMVRPAADGCLQVTLLDFGIAKLLDRGRTPRR